jgi:hypothetical protein
LWFLRSDEAEEMLESNRRGFRGDAYAGP